MLLQEGVPGNQDQPLKLGFANFTVLWVACSARFALQGDRKRQDRLGSLSRFQAHRFFGHYGAGAPRLSKPQAQCGALTHHPEVQLHRLGLPGTLKQQLNDKGGGCSKAGKEGPSPAERDQRLRRPWGEGCAASLDRLLSLPALLTITFWFVRFISLTFKTIQKEKCESSHFADVEPRVVKWLVGATQPRWRAEAGVLAGPAHSPWALECRGVLTPTGPLMLWELPKLLQREHLPDGFSTGQ